MSSLLLMGVGSPFAAAAAGNPLFDASSGATNSTSGTPWETTFAHTCTGSNLVLYVGCMSENIGTNVTSVTYNGEALEFVGESIGTAAGTFGTITEIWRKIGPATGANNIVVAIESDDAIKIASVSFKDTHQTTPNGSVFAADGTSSAPSVAVTDSATGEIVVDWCTAVDLSQTPPTFTVGASQTERQNLTENTYDVAGCSTEPGASGSVTMSWTSNVSVDWSIAAISIKGA